MNVNAKAGNPPKFGVCIDTETSGCSDGLIHTNDYQVLSIGVIIFDFASYSAIDACYCEIKFDQKYKWDVNAEKIHGLTKEHLNKNGMTMQEAACEIGTLLIKYLGPQPFLYLLGHNVGYDKQFLDQIFASAGLELRYSHLMLDTSTSGLLLLNKYRSNDLFELLGFETRGEHNSLEDAMMTLEAAKLMRMIFNEGLK